MSLPFIHGPIANVFTCFDADGRIDDDGQRAFLDFLFSRGSVSAYFVRSGMGQMYTYSYDDTVRMARLATAHLADKAPVLVGTTGIWNRDFEKRPDRETFLKQAEDLTRIAEDCGAAGTVHTMPEALAPTGGETTHDVTLRYFERVCAVAGKPVLIYQPPPTIPEYHITARLAAELAQFPNLAGMKLSSGDAGYILDICHATRNTPFHFICGNEMSFYAGLHCGAKAVIGQGCCVNPSILKAVQDRFDAGDMDGAMEAQVAANGLVYASPPAVPFMKRYANEQGFKVPPHSRPEIDKPYGPEVDAIGDDTFTAYKTLLEAEIARFA